MKEKISITLEKNLIKDLDKIIDNIFIKNRSHAIEFLVRKSLGEQKSAVLLLGGDVDLLRIENEFRATMMIKGKPLIVHQVEKLKKEGFKSIYIVSRSELLNRIFEIIKNGEGYGVNVNYIEEVSAKGTMDSLRLLQGKINSTFLVIFGDLYFEKIRLQELWESHIKHDYTSTLILTTSPTPSQKGIVKLEGSKILDFTQKPKQTDVYIGFSSIFVSEPKLLDLEGQSLELDVFPKLAREGYLGGHVSSEKEIHIHEKDDVKKV
jgi:NDP-sugar pyrophosphorylase family protein